MSALLSDTATQTDVQFAKHPLTVPSPQLGLLRDSNTLLGNAAWLGYYHGGASGIGLDSTNRIIAAGYSLDSGSTVVTVARYTAAGVLDTSFADSGISRTVVGSSTLSLSNGMIVEAGGNILLAGTVWSYYADGGYGSFGSDVLLKRIEP